ncbi:hypothetical protein AOLI_G00202730 [Acnodon oligacanthus]
MPTFSFDVELLLETGNKAYQKDGTLLNNPKVISSILEKLAEAIFCYTAYPTGIKVLNVVEALVDKFPCLKEPGSFNGMYGWLQRIKYKMSNYWTKLRGRQLACPELELNFLKRKNNDEPHLKGIKRHKKAETKGGVAGIKIRCLLDSLGQQQEGRQDAVIRCLIHFLGESCEELIKDYQDISKGMIKDGSADLAMKIIVLASAAAEAGATPDSVIIVIDGTELSDNLSLSRRS